MQVWKLNFLNLLLIYKKKFFFKKVTASLYNIRRKKIVWKKACELKTDRIMYIQLFKKKLKLPWEKPITQQEDIQFSQIESKRNSNDLIL